MTNTNSLLKGFNLAVIKRCEENQVDKERFLFLALCSDHDRALLGNEEKMGLDDLERISCLMLSLGLENLYSHFLMQHLGLLKIWGSKIEKEITDTANIEKELGKPEFWYEEFLDQLPSKKMRYFIEKVLYV